MVDTFYAIGLVMQLCQSISLLELLHIYVGIESNHLLPRFLQVGLNHIIYIIESVAYVTLFCLQPLDFMAVKNPTFANVQPKSLTWRISWKNDLILKPAQSELPVGSIPRNGAWCFVQHYSDPLLGRDFISTSQSHYATASGGVVQRKGTGWEPFRLGDWCLTPLPTLGYINHHQPAL